MKIELILRVLPKKITLRRAVEMASWTGRCDAGIDNTESLVRTSFWTDG